MRSSFRPISPSIMKLPKQTIVGQVTTIIDFKIFVILYT